MPMEVTFIQDMTVLAIVMFGLAIALALTIVILIAQWSSK